MLLFSSAALVRYIVCVVAIDLVTGVGCSGGGGSVFLYCFKLLVVLLLHLKKIKLKHGGDCDFFFPSSTPRVQLQWPLLLT